jgi:hypothetical protein
MSIYWDVAPRYTGGSPAMVDRETARRVAVQEKLSYEHALKGIYGPLEQVKAAGLGLAGIVEERYERAKGWQVRDVITEEEFFRPFEVRVGPPSRREVIRRRWIYRLIIPHAAFEDRCRLWYVDDLREDKILAHTVDGDPAGSIEPIELHHITCAEEVS